MLGNHRYACIFAVWKASQGTAIGSFFVADAVCNSPSGHVIFWQDHLLCQWTCTSASCYVIQCVVLNVYHSLANLFHFFNLSLLAWHPLWRLLQLQQESCPLWFPLPNVVITRDGKLIIGPFIFMVLGYLYSIVEPCLVLCARFMMAFGYLRR